MSLLHVVTKVFYWPVNIARYRTVDRWPYFHWFKKSRDIDLTKSRRRPDSRTWRTRMLKRLNSNGYASGKSEYNFVEKMKVYNKTVIYWVLGQPQFCLTLERICWSQPAASGNRSVLGSNKIAVVLEPSQYLPGVCIHEDNTCSYFSFIFLDYKIYV